MRVAGVAGRIRSGGPAGPAEVQGVQDVSGSEVVRGVRHLWRGDQVENGAGDLYRDDGLLVRQPDGGDPRYVLREGLWYAVQAHVAPDGVTEQQFRDQGC